MHFGRGGLSLLVLQERRSRALLACRWRARPPLR